MSAMLLPTRMVEKVWGCEQLPEPFEAPQGSRIGEIWFEPPEDLDQLLAKYLFTSEKLSVQVHPPGKDECWLILDCEPGASLAVGFRENYGIDQLRRGADDGSIEQMLAWREVEPGDFVYLPAGTVHAIGAGCTLVEIQQNCGITYRFYDYGRPRELHVEQALEHAERGPHDPMLRMRVGEATQCLANGPFFRLDRVVGPVPDGLRDYHATACLVLPLQGTAGVSGRPIPPGSCARIGNIADLSVPEESIVLVCSARS